MEKYQKTAAQMAEDKRDKVVIDLRKEQEYKMGTCPGALNTHWKKLEEKLQSDGVDALQLPKNQPIYLLCYTGETSDEYAKYFCRNGYEAYSVLEGYRGYLRWSFGGRA